MRKQMIQDAAYEVATQVRAVEETIDTALNEIAELQARIMHANSVAGVGFGVIHPTLEKLGTAVTGLIETRGAIVGCHAALADASGRFAAWLVAESTIIANTAHPPKPGARTAGWSQATFDQILEATAAMQALAHLTDDHAEGVAAALDKRAPGFTGA